MMEFKEQKTPKTVDNSAYNDRFKFVLWANENIVCERYFKIGRFDYDAIYSERMMSLFVGDGDFQYGSIISMIINDLKSKSRVWSWYMAETPLKLTGFAEGEEVTYLYYPKREEPKVEKIEDGIEIEPEIIEPFVVTFKFAFQMAQTVTSGHDGKPLFSDYKSLYEVIWDGSVYPKFVRNSVDLTNSIVGTIPGFINNLTHHMICDKKDLTYHIIREIYDAATFDVEEPLSVQRKQRVVSYLKYGDKNYPMSDFDKEYVEGWRKATEKKTRDYQRGRL